jgi:pyrrolidone-carboxylate peptidase
MMFRVVSPERLDDMNFLKEQHRALVQLLLQASTSSPSKSTSKLQMEREYCHRLFTITIGPAGGQTQITIRHPVITVDDFRIRKTLFVLGRKKEKEHFCLKWLLCGST